MAFWDDWFKSDFWNPLKDSINNQGGFTNPATKPITHMNNTFGGAGGSFAKPKGAKLKEATNSESRDSGRIAASTPWKSGDGGVTAPPPVADIPNANAADQNAVLEGYLREIQDRLASNKAVAPTITLNTKPIDTAKEASLKALTNALNSVVGGIEVARNNTKQAYGQAKTDTQGAYDHVVANSRKEGKKAAEDSGNYTQKALSDAASLAMAGINQDMTNSDAMQAQASKNLGGSASALKEIDRNVNPNDSTGTIRNNIAQDFQAQAGNAARQTSRDINASSRYADTIASDGASAIADLVAELASRNNQYDRDISDARSSNATNVANVQSTYADKLMQAQLAQQQEQNAVDRTAWQTNVNNDSAALQGMIDLIGSDNKSRLEQELIAQEAAAKNANSGQRSNDKQLEILLEGLMKNTEKNSINRDDILEMIRQLQG